LYINVATIDNFLQVLCELWMGLFPDLQEARLFVEEPEMSFGTVFRDQEGLKIIWDKPHLASSLA